MTTFPVVAISRLRMATDGAGVTTLVCTHGCPLRCAYCLNKFTWDDRTPVEFLTARALYDRVRCDSLYFEATGGGVTFGGGEPLLYADFFPLFREVCGAGWKLVAETCLSVPRENLLLAVSAIDEFIVDVKDTDGEVYRAYTGQENMLAMENLRLLSALVDPARIHVRLPLIKDYNTEEHRNRSEALLCAMGITDIERFTYIIR